MAAQRGARTSKKLGATLAHAQCRSATEKTGSHDGEELEAYPRCGAKVKNVFAALAHGCPPPHGDLDVQWALDMSGGKPCSSTAPITVAPRGTNIENIDDNSNNHIITNEPTQNDINQRRAPSNSESDGIHESNLGHMDLLIEGDFGDIEGRNVEHSDDMDDEIEFFDPMSDGEAFENDSA